MSNCRICGKEVIWVAKEDGSGWFPPMESDGKNYFNVTWNGTTYVGAPQQKEATLVRHVCNPSTPVVTEWIENYAATPVVVPSEEKIEMDADNERQKKIKFALKISVKCETCGAKKFEWCTYKNEPGKFTTVLHARR